MTDLANDTRNAELLAYEARHIDIKSFHARTIVDAMPLARSRDHAPVPGTPPRRSAAKSATRTPPRARATRSSARAT